MEAFRLSSDQPSIMDNLRSIVSKRFIVEDELMEFNVPTFYIAKNPRNKENFLKLLEELDPLDYLALMREVGERIRIQIYPKTRQKPSDTRISKGLFLTTIATTFVAGYFQSTGLTYPYFNAALFTIAIMSILGLHEAGHKLAAKKYSLEASEPYFIPGPPPLGTFGAVIKQKSQIPNKDALFDLGAVGPIMGFIITVIVTAFGLQISELRWVPAIPPGTLSTPILYQYLAGLLLTSPPNPSNFPHLLITLHPVAFAGYVGMLVTMLNLIPVGQLDGGHIAFCFLRGRGRRLMGFIAIAILFLIGYWLFALFAMFTMSQPHPEPLDNVSKLSKSRKVSALVIIVIFILSFVPPSLF